MINIKRLFQQDFILIEQFLEDNFSSPTHWPDWNLLVSKYFNTRFYYYVAVDNNKIVGIFPAHQTKKGIRSVVYSGQFHYIPNGGWIFSQEMPISKLPLKQAEAAVSSGLPLLPEFNNNPVSDLHAETLIVDLRKEEEEIWKQDIHSKRRNKIRKAIKLGVEIKSLELDQLELFYQVYSNANKRYNLDSLPIDFFKELLKMNKNIHFDILSAKQNNHILNIVVIAYDKDYAIYWLGFSSENIPNNGQGDLLQWEAIKRMKNYGCQYYDLCYIDKEKLPHIYKFKSGFSKNEVKIPLINQRTFSYRVLNKLSKWF